MLYHLNRLNELLVDRKNVCQEQRVKYNHTAIINIFPKKKKKEKRNLELNSLKRNKLWSKSILSDVGLLEHRRQNKNMLRFWV